MNRDDYRHLLLAGTVTFPATFPQLGSISLISESIPCGVENQSQREVLIVKEFPSAKVTLARRIFSDKVRAVFIPQDPCQVSYACGTWLLANEIATFLRLKRRVLGIVFVPESESTLLEVRAGMTAGESAQYYPPLPHDRSINHYGGPSKHRHMMSCNSNDDANLDSSLARTLDSASMVGESIGVESFFSCNQHDDISFEMCSCNFCDVPSES